MLWLPGSAICFKASRSRALDLTDLNWK